MVIPPFLTGRPPVLAILLSALLVTACAPARDQTDEAPDSVEERVEAVPEEDAPPIVASCPQGVEVLGASLVAGQPGSSLVTVLDRSARAPEIRTVQPGDRVTRTATVTAIGEEEHHELGSIAVVELRTDDGRREICRGGEVVHAQTGTPPPGKDDDVDAMHRVRRPPDGRGSFASGSDEGV